MNSNFLFNIESVSEGHPDKLADQIAELILDFLMLEDKNAHVACEVFITKNKIIVGGEIKLNKNEKWWQELNFKLEKKIIFFLLEEIKYNETTWPGIGKIKIEFLFNKQSIEICNQILLSEKKIGAGDNTIVFGFAVDEKGNEYYPKFQTLANLILQKIQILRKKENNKFNFAPDGKIRITIKNENGFEEIKKIILCQQFEKKEIFNKKETMNIILEKIIYPILKKLSINRNDFEFILKFFFNGGPSADSGLTGRKLMIDTYGVYSRHGGGSFSGKDITKTDKTLALFARYIAKHIVYLNLIEQIEIQISVFIGEYKNFDIIFFTKNNKEIDDFKIKKILNFFSKWDLKKIINELDLKNTKFVNFAKYGYFGLIKNRKIPIWEKLNHIKELENILNIKKIKKNKELFLKI